jgi:hypothetical protein
VRARSSHSTPRMRSSTRSRPWGLGLRTDPCAGRR